MVADVADWVNRYHSSEHLSEVVCVEGERRVGAGSRLTRVRISEISSQSRLVVV